MFPKDLSREMDCLARLKVYGLKNPMTDLSAMLMFGKLLRTA